MIDVRFQAANLDRRLSARGREPQFDMVEVDLSSATITAAPLRRHVHSLFECRHACCRHRQPL